MGLIQDTEEGGGPDSSKGEDVGVTVTVTGPSRSG